MWFTCDYHVIPRYSSLLHACGRVVSCPDPTLCEGKGVWWIWTQSSGQGKEFERSNEIAALAQSYDLPTAGMQSAIACYINLNCQPAPKQHYWPIRSKVCFSTTVAARAHWAGQTKKQSKFTRPLFPRRGWGLGTRLVWGLMRYHTKTMCCHTNHMTCYAQETTWCIPDPFPPWGWDLRTRLIQEMFSLLYYCVCCILFLTHSWFH